MQAPVRLCLPVEAVFIHRLAVDRPDELHHLRVDEMIRPLSVARAIIFLPLKTMSVPLSCIGNNRSLVSAEHGIFYRGSMTASIVARVQYMGQLAMRLGASVFPASKLYL